MTSLFSIGSFQHSKYLSVLPDLSITNDLLVQLQPLGEGLQATPLTEVTLSYLLLHLQGLNILSE